MACSRCDGYEFVPATTDADGPLMDCPDCRAVDERPLVWCPIHSTRVEMDGRCRKCCVEAANAEEIILAPARAAEAKARAAQAILTARTPREVSAARDLVVRARLAAEAVAA